MTTEIIEIPEDIEKLDAQENLGEKALKAFARICEHWNASVDEQCKLLNLGLIDLFQLQSHPSPKLNHDQLRRIKSMVAIYKASVRKHGTVPGVRREVRSPRPGYPFFNRSPIHLMVSEGLQGIESTLHAVTQESAN